ncbi:MAG TPA: hypothetical protein VFY29_18975 [Terriglobia bacterium]|nr:hypothetical protein [Terriglobia bacterium]
MSDWFTSLLSALLLVAVPFTMVVHVLSRLPRPLASSYGQWPLFANRLLIGVVTAAVAIFLHSIYYGGPVSSSAIAAKFLLAALIYGFGFALLLRQAAGVYPEFIVTLGWAGLGLRKTAYTNIVRVESVSRNAAETRLRVDTAHGSSISFTLATRDVGVFQQQVRKDRERSE